MRASVFKLFGSEVPDLRGLLLVVLAGSWLAGTCVNAWLLLPPFVLLTAGLFALLLVYLCWCSVHLRLGALVLLCLCLGAWRYATVAPANDTHAIRAFIGVPTLEVQGEVSADPRLESQSTLLTVNTQRISLDNGLHWQEIDGTIQVQIAGATFDDPYAPRYGDTLQLEGRLSAPPGYATPELQASMAFPKMSISSHGGNPLLLLFYQLRTRLAGILLQALPQPFAALLMAIFLSLRTPALEPLAPLFNMTGLAHLLAPSGFKVTLFAGLIGNGTRWLVPGYNPQNRQLLPAEYQRDNWRRWLQTLLLMLCIALYTILSGAGPAALRAGIMGILLTLAPRLKRSYNVYTALALTALFLCIIDPFLLWDSSFQLSFIGTLGILLFTPLFMHFFSFLTRWPPGFHIAEILAVTLAAELATWPIIALSFSEISLIAPLANLLSVPLLGILLALGALICLSGLLVPSLALICGWLAWPLLWYIMTVISWCAHVPGAYLPVGGMLSPLTAWIYYVLLAWGTLLLFTRWQPANSHDHERTPILPRRAKLLIQATLALLMLGSTALLAQTAQSDRYLTIMLLSNHDPAQGQALFLRTPDGQTALIDEGASSTTLAQTLDTHLPFWQRSLGLVILSDTSPANLAGLQDVLARYQVQHVVDAGMLHPSLAYANWRNTLATRNLPYTQVRQGALIALDQQISFQVLWPPASLHKSSDETHDNALVLRLLAPGLSLLLLNSASLSTYALQNLLLNSAAASLQAEIAQCTGEAGKAFPATLATTLTLAHPTLLLLTTIPARQRKSAARPVAPASPPAGSWQVLQGTQTGSLELQSDTHGWHIGPSG